MKNKGSFPPRNWGTILKSLTQMAITLSWQIAHIIGAVRTKSTQILGEKLSQTSVFFSNKISSVQLLSCVQLCDPMDCLASMPGLPVHHQLQELTQTHVHQVSDAIQPSQPLLSPSPPTFNLSQHQGLFKWVSSSHQVAKVLEFQLQPQSLQWIFRTD